MGVKHEYKMHIKFALKSNKIQYVKIYEDIYIKYEAFKICIKIPHASVPAECIASIIATRRACKIYMNFLDRVSKRSLLFAVSGFPIRSGSSISLTNPRSVLLQ